MKFTFFYIQYEHHNSVYLNLLKSVESFSDYGFCGMQDAGRGVVKSPYSTE